MPGALDRAGTVALWLQLYDDLVQRIEGAEFPDTFPGEIDLTNAYGVSRHTVREALGRLRCAGVIRSSGGRSSVVDPALISQDLGAMYSLFHELEDRGTVQRSEVLVIERRRDDVVGDRLGLRPAPRPSTSNACGARTRSHSPGTAPGSTLTWRPRSWTSTSPAPPSTTSGTVVPGVRLSDEREIIRAVVPTAGQRQLLDMATDEAALMIERVGLSGGHPVEFRRTLVRGSRFSLTAHWSSSRR